MNHIGYSTTDNKEEIRLTSYYRSRTLDDIEIYKTLVTV